MTPNPPSKSTVERGAVVPAWHTLVLLAVIFGFSFASARAGSLTPFGPKTGRALGYLLVIIFEWAKRNPVVAGVSPANFSPVTRPACRGGLLVTS